MAFSETEFRDIIHYLHAHPEAVAELRPLVLTEDVLNLPKLVADIAVEVRLLIEQGREHDARLAEMKRETESLRQDLQRESADVRQELDRVSAELKEEMAKLAAEVRGSVTRFDKHVGQHGNYDGELNEARFIRNADNWFDDIIRKPVRIGVRDIPELEAAVGSGIVEANDFAALRRADAIFAGGKPGNPAARLYAVCEFSNTIDESDVQRAFARASVLRAAGVEVVPVAGGNLITRDAEALAKSLDVRIEIHEPAK